MKICGKRFLFRICSITIDRAKELIALGDDLELSRLTSQERELLTASNPFLSSDRYKRLNAATRREVLIKSISRAAYRSVPFALYSGTGIGAETDSFTLDFSSGRTRVARFVSAASPKVAVNPTCDFRESEIRFFARSKSGALNRKVIASEPAILNLLKRSSYDATDPAIARCLELGLLQRENHTKIRIEKDPSAVSDPKETVLFYEGARLGLSRRELNHVLSGARALMELTRLQSTRVLQIVERLKKSFLERYEYRWVPFLELCDFVDGLGEEITLAAQAQPQKGGDLFNDIMTLAIERGAMESGAFELTEGDLQILRQRHQESFDRREEMPRAASALGSLVLDGDAPTIRIKSIFGPSLVRPYARLHGLPGYDVVVKTLATSERRSQSGQILAEIHHLSEDPSFSSSARLTSQFSHHIAVHPLVTDDSREIPLRELDVSIREGRFVLRWGDQEIQPVVTNLMNFYKDAHLHYQLLCLISHQNEFSLTCWLWGQFSALRSLPRVNFQGAILSPRIFRITDGEGRRLRDVSLDELRQRLGELGIPKEFVVLDWDEEIHYDQLVDASLELFRKWLGFDLRLAEYFPPAPFEGQSRTHDFFIPLINPSSAEMVPVKKRREQRISKQQKIHHPGSEWEYVRIYLPKSRINRLVCGEVADLFHRLSKTGGASDSHFLGYEDPHAHLRIRSKHRAGLSSVAKWAEKLALAGKISSFEIASYEPEYSRYGSPQVMRVTEKLFGLDSCFVLDSLSSLESGNEIDLNVFLKISAFRLLKYLEAARGFSSFSDMAFRPMPTHPRPAFRATVRAVKSALRDPAVDEQALALERIYKRYRAREIRLFSQLENLALRGELGCTPMEYVLHLSHMSLFRTDLHLARRFEDLVRKIVYEIIESKKGTGAST